MFRRATKKQLLIRRIITYAIMVLAVIVIVSGTILFILGYRLDSDKGRLEQGALIQFDSRPNGAAVSVDGVSIKANTPAKQTVLAGRHTFAVNRSQYQPWSKTLDVKAGTLQWLDYIRLVPKNLPVQAVAKYATVSAEKASPDNKWVLIQERADNPTFQLIDLRAQQVKTSTIALPAAIYSESTNPTIVHSFAIESWDDDGRYVIVRHSFDDKTEYLVMDTQDPDKSSNVSTLLSISLSELKFSGTSGTTLYGLTDGIVRRLDLANATISRSLVSHVKNFTLFDSSIIAYTGTDPDNPAFQVAGIYREGDELPHVLRVVQDLTTPLSIAVTQYYSDDYVAVAEGRLVTVLKGRYPSSTDMANSSLKLQATLNVAAPVAWLSFSGEGDRLLAQSGLHLTSYEVEYGRQTDTMITTSESTAHRLRWLDNAYLWAVYDGHLSIREFDGLNTQVIMNMEPGFDATVTQSGKYIYGIAKSSDGYQLQRVMMILN